MKINIRSAVKNDCSRMMELIHELALYEKSPQEVTVEFEHFVNSGFGENPVWWAYIAEITDDDNATEIVGFALYYIRYSTWKGKRIYLEDIIITEKMRGNGIGTLLFNKVLELSVSSEYNGISWQVLNWNTPALNFYHKFYGLLTDDAWVNCSINNEKK